MAALSDPQRHKRGTLRHIACLESGKAVAEAVKPDLAPQRRLQVTLQVALADGRKRREADDTLVDDRRQGHCYLHGGGAVSQRVDGITGGEKPAAVVAVGCGDIAGQNEIAAIRNGGGDNAVVMKGEADHRP